MIQGSESGRDVGGEDRGAHLEVRNVAVDFGGIRALKDVSIDLAGGCCGIIGPNGAGKTTLLDTLAGLRTPTSGSVELDGVDVTRRSATWLARRGVRRTFQRNQAFGWLSVEENLLVAAEWRGRERRVIADLVRSPGARRRELALRGRIDEVLAECGLEEVRSKPSATLPIGQLRLLEFARAIVDRPRLLLLDEPTSGLGVEDTARLAAAVTALTATRECVAIVVEHDLEFVLGLCDRLVVLELGEIIADGQPDVVCRDERVVDAYIGVH